MSEWAIIAAFALPALVPLAITLINVLSWQRGDSREDVDAKISVLIPARNEQDNIESCIRAVFASDVPVHEVWVCDDNSSDRTPAILQRLKREFSALHSFRGKAMPAGWVGKPHACHQLAQRASGDVLLFVDADTQLHRGGLRRMMSLLGSRSERRADIVTAVPRQIMSSFAERLIIPLLHVTYTSWLPMRLVAASSDPRFVAANGQLLAVRADAYQRVGGFAAVGSEIVDDVAFCRHAKTQRATVVFADGHHMASCRMYQSARQVWEGFSKNLYEGIGGSPFALLAVVALYGSCFVAPYIGLAIGLTIGSGALVQWSAAGVLANLLLRGVLCWRHGHPLAGMLVHPIAVLGLLAIAFNSFWCSSRGVLRWSGRTYRSRTQRLEISS